MIALIRRISFVIAIVAALIISAAGGAFAEFVYDDTKTWDDLTDAIKGGQTEINLKFGLTQPDGGDMINIKGDVKFYSSTPQKITYRDMFSIDAGGTLTIGGDAPNNGQITLESAVGGVTGVLFAGSGNVIFNNVVINNDTKNATVIDLSSNGKAALNGGKIISCTQGNTAAIKVPTGGEVIFDGVTIGGPTAAEGNKGQVVNVSGGTVEFKGNTTFSNNSSTGGGNNVNAAVTVESGNLSVGDGSTAVTVSNNTNTVFRLNGGSKEDPITFNDPKFTANNDSTKTIIVSGGNTKFESPKFESNANVTSMISVEGGDVSFNTPTFTGNTGKKAIDITNGTLTITGGTFGGSTPNANSATPLVNLDGGKLVATNVNFTYNTGDVFHSGAGESTFTSCKFDNNKADGKDGDQVIRIAGGQVTFDKGTISNNEPKVTGTGAGATIDVSDGTAIFKGQITVSGNAERALRLSEASAFAQLSDAIFEGNNKGAAEIIKGTLRVENTIFRNNGGQNPPYVDFGGAIYCHTDGVLEFVGTANKHFTGNHAGKGGALYLDGSRKLPDANTSNMLFDGNIATDDGGAIYATGDITLENGVSFNGNNTEKGDGGALYSEGIVTVNGDVLFDDNHAKRNGGAIYTSKESSTSKPEVAVVLKAGRFTNNAAEPDGVGAGGNGGAVYTKTRISVESNAVEFTNNIAKGSGGAIYTEDTAFSAAGPDIAVNIKGGIFKENQADNGDGGAICAWNGARGGGVRVEGGTFDDNKALSTAANSGRGGAIFCEGIIAKTANGSVLEFTKNRCGKDGGAIYSACTSTSDLRQVIVEKVSMRSNSAGNAGGACFVERQDKVPSTRNSTGFYDSEFYDNSAASGGALEFPNGAGAWIENCSFVLNKSLVRSGGAIKTASNNVSTTVKNCYFENNISASKGGAIVSEVGGIADNSKLGIVQSVFYKNEAADSGGAIWTDHPRFDIRQSTINANILSGGSATGGAGIFTASSRYLISNTTFYGNNTESGNGGGLYLASGAGVDGSSAVIYCTFVENEVNAGTGFGGGIYYDGAGEDGINLCASVLVSNRAYYGADIFRQSKGLTSGGYNVIGDYAGRDREGNIGEPGWDEDSAITREREGVRSAKDEYKKIPAYTAKDAFVVENGKAVLDAHYAEKVPFVAGTLTINITVNQRSVDTVKILTSGVAYNRVDKSYVRTKFQRLLGASLAGSGINHLDARGVGRDNYEDEPRVGYDVNADAGAYQTIGNSDPTPPKPKTGNVDRVAMGGVPNFTLRVGQTVHLTASVYVIRKGETFPVRDLSEGVMWTSSNPSVAFIDQYGTMTLLGQGEAIITATSISYSSHTAGRRESDSKRIVVNLPGSNINASANVWNAIDSYNTSLYSAGVQITLADIPKAESAAFVSGFRSEFGIDPMHITTFDIAGSPSPSYNAPSTTYNGAERAVRPSMGVSMGTQMPSGGGAIALRFSYSLTWAEVSELLGRQTTSLNASNAEELFRVLSIVFKDESGNAVPVIGKNSGISYANVISSNALRIGTLDARAGGVDAAGGDDRFVMDLELMISDAKANGSNTAKMINGMIVVGDGTPNGRINGNMWLLAPNSGGGNSGGSGGSGSGSGGSGEGGGGGCAAGAFALALIAIPFALRMKKR